MKTIVFQFQHQENGSPKKVEKVMTNYINYYSLDLKMILNNMSKKLKKDAFD